MSRSFVCAPLLVTLAAFAADNPRTPTQALDAFRLEPGLRVELVAAEPLTASPCALTWDAQGRLFVAENRGYPTGGPEGKPLGVIALLEDSDGDGQWDRRRVFADELTFPNGLTPWRGGFVVTCAPDVLWLADTNGDGRADVRRVLLTGFATNGSTQLRVSHPTLGPDGWIWLTCGLRGGEITSPQHPDRPALKTSTDVRFHPDTLEVEAVDGRGQFGQSFDEDGRRFICMNRVQVQHVVMPSRWLKRNPHLAVPETVQNCPDLVPNPLMKGGGGAARLYPISENVTTADSHAGTFTAACGLHLYRGDRLRLGDGSPLTQAAISCDPTANLVHWDKLVPSGGTFAARRSTNQSELLASTDNWFRPVFLATGPEGALYIADMYRKTIEHPDYLPEAVRQRTDFESGRGRGRLWRIVPSNGVAHGSRPFPALARATAEQLCKALNETNSWGRDTAFRLLLERRDLSIVPRLRMQAAAGELLAARLLAAFGKLDEATWVAGFDRARDARDAWFELASSWWEEWPRLQSRVIANIQFRDRTGICALLASGGIDYLPKRSNLLRLFEAPTEPDPWQRMALLGSLRGQSLAFLTDLARQNDRARQRTFDESQLGLFSDLSRLAATEASPEERRSLAWGLADFARQCESREERSPVEPNPVVDWDLAMLQGVVEGLGPSTRLGELFAGTHPWNEFLAKPSPINTNRSHMVRTGIDGVRHRSRRALTPPRPLIVRIAAARLLGECGEEADGTLLLESFHRETPPELNQAVVRSLVRLGGSKLIPLLFRSSRWNTMTPTMREQVLSAVFAQPNLLVTVLDAMESGALSTSALGPARRNQLQKHAEGGMRRRAEALLGTSDKGDRMQAYQDTKAALALVPRSGRGREVFQRACANCHRLDREGVAVGPDLFDIRSQPKETILLHIIVPEHEIAPNFTGYTVETKDGRTLSGLITAESASGVTLKQSAGVEETVRRSNIASLEAMRLSLMPQELEKAMTTQELADLLAYLKGEL